MHVVCGDTHLDRKLLRDRLNLRRSPHQRQVWHGRLKLCAPDASSLSVFSAPLNYSGDATKATRVVHGSFIGFFG
jgi:hypothetical protein